MHCWECGNQIFYVEIKCPGCNESFCSETCLNQHYKDVYEDRDDEEVLVDD